MYGYDWANISTQKLTADKAKASNMPYGGNPAYASTDFLSFFPQFTAVCTATGEVPPQVPDALLQNFIDRANASLSYSKYFENWTYCMGLFIAHNITLFLSASQSTTATGIISGAEPVKPTTSESVGDVSASYDTSVMTDDAQGWGMWKTTSYGLQLIAYAKLAGMGGMLV
jgi:hypothetical protein